jgi:hypothetical protein
VANGSLVLAVSLLMALRSARLASRASQAAEPTAHLVGSAL